MLVDDYDTHLNTTLHGSAGVRFQQEFIEATWPLDVVNVSEAAGAPVEGRENVAPLDDAALLMRETGVTREVAESALVAYNGDLISALMSLI